MSAAGLRDKALTIFEGGSALSDFRARGLLARVQAVAPGVSGLAARHVHVVATEAALTGAERDRVGRLLTYGPPYAGPPADEGTLVVVTPRLGTISPWASKATDIARNCGVASAASSGSPSTS
jgi:phosphoribosylformylglycinamidine synthase